MHSFVTFQKYGNASDQLICNWILSCILIFCVCVCCFKYFVESKVTRMTRKKNESDPFQVYESESEKVEITISEFHSG